jgi:hypothetical protein
MISYVKIYGPPLMKALRALEKVAVDMPEVCIMSTNIQAAMGVGAVSSYGTEGPVLDSAQWVTQYFGGSIPEERCGSIISKSGQSLGRFDFYFEWFTEPNMEQVEGLIEKIDEALTPLGVKYTLTTK